MTGEVDVSALAVTTSAKMNLGSFSGGFQGACSLIFSHHLSALSSSLYSPSLLSLTYSLIFFAKKGTASLTRPLPLSWRRLEVQPRRRC